MRTLRYGADASWPFEGHALPVDETIETAILTITGRWAEEDEEQPPEPPDPLLQITVTPTLSASGVVLEAQDGYGNWSVVFELSAAQTSVDLAPDSAGVGRYLWYEVTLLTAAPGSKTYRPWVGQIRMLPDLYIAP